MTVWLATSDAYPDLTLDDQRLLEALRAQGVAAEVLQWRGPVVPAESDLVIIRSCWDYHLDAPGFLAWLQRLEANGARLANGFAPIRDTLHKSYLLRLQRDFGVRIPGTLLLPRGEQRSLDECKQTLGSDRLVVKPAVSLSAYQTWRTGSLAEQVEGERFATQVDAMDVLVQAYVPGIVDRGELSLVFLGGEYSHAVRKVPKAGDFRVQGDFGGTVAATDVEPSVGNEARRIMAAACPGALYARIDGVATDEGFTLMEVEVIDPVLFLGASAGAAERLAAAIAQDIAEPAVA